MSTPDPQFNPASDAGASDESIQKVHAHLQTEKSEPTESGSMMPLFILGFVSSVIFIVSVYFVRSVHSREGFDPLVYDERVNPKLLTAGAAKVAVDPVVAGKKLYLTAGACVTCHQPSGQGAPPAFPPLVKTDWVTGSDERLIRILLHGLSGEITVNGQKYNGAMPAFGLGSGYNYSDDKIAAVLTYIRQEWGNTGGPITPERVAEIRTKGAAGRNKPWTEAELMALP